MIALVSDADSVGLVHQVCRWFWARWGWAVNEASYPWYLNHESGVPYPLLRGPCYLQIDRCEMDRLEMHSPDGVEAKLNKLAALFPGVVSEVRDDNGDLQRGIDLEALKQEFSSRISEGPKERYHLDWPGKKEATLLANAPIAKSLRPNSK